MDLREQLELTLGDASSLERFKREIVLAARSQHGGARKVRNETRIQALLVKAGVR